MSKKTSPVIGASPPAQGLFVETGAVVGTGCGVDSGRGVFVSVGIAFDSPIGVEVTAACGSMLKLKLPSVE